MADYSLASFSLTTVSPAQVTRIRFVFANLTAESPGNPYNSASEAWKFTPDTPEADEAIQAALARFTPIPEGFAGQFFAFAHALRSDGAFPVTLDDSYQSLELLSAFFLSARTNQPVDLPIQPDHPYYDGWLPK